MFQFLSRLLACGCVLFASVLVRADHLDDLAVLKKEAAYTDAVEREVTRALSSVGKLKPESKKLFRGLAETYYGEALGLEMLLLNAAVQEGLKVEVKGLRVRLDALVASALEASKQSFKGKELRGVRDFFMYEGSRAEACVRAGNSWRRVRDRFDASALSDEDFQRLKQLTLTYFVEHFQIVEGYAWAYRGSPGPSSIEARGESLALRKKLKSPRSKVKHMLSPQVYADYGDALREETRVVYSYSTVSVLPQ